MLDHIFCKSLYLVIQVSNSNDNIRTVILQTALVMNLISSFAPAHSDGCFTTSCPSNVPRRTPQVPHTHQVLVSNWRHHQAWLFNDLDATEVIRTFGDGRGDGDRELNFPHGVALMAAEDVDPDSVALTSPPVRADPTLVAIVDSNNHRVVLYRLCDASS